ncbi:MAG: LysR family transcriptional regulator [Proteobacteria bacterium]|nr:LysR family transcriptional regulator [Pseudomonadota bacterium]
MDWNDLRFFLAVARCHSLTEASRGLRVSQATVARRIQALEQALAAPLFTKSHDGYALTVQGEALLPHAEQAEAHMLWLERGGAVPREEEAGIVRLAMPELLGQHLIIPALAPFCEAHPQIRLEAEADVRPVSLKRREADVLVRLVRPTHGDYTLKRVGSIALALYAAPAYVVRHDLPTTLGELEHHRLIGWNTGLGFLPFSSWLVDAVPAAKVAFRAHTMSAQLAAVEAGLGLAVLPAFIARKFGLERALPQEKPFFSDIWLLLAADSQHVTRVRLLADHLCDLLSGHTEELTRVE